MSTNPLKSTFPTRFGRFIPAHRRSRMRMSHYVGASVLVSSLLYFSFPICGSHTVHAQQPDASANQDTASAIQLYKQGDTIQAIKLLRAIVDKHPDDADAWYYLG